MVIHTRKTIEKCPYTSTITLPPPEKHKSTFGIIAFVEKGECEIEFYNKDDKEPKTFLIKENDCFIYRPFTLVHFKNVSSNYTHRNIHVDEDVFKECCNLLDPDLFNEIESKDYPLIFTLSAPSIIYFAERCSLLTGDKAKDKDIIYKSLICESISSYISSKIVDTTQPPWIKALLRNLENTDFLIKTIDEMVKTTNYSHGYVNREFKKHLGIPLKKYVLNKKLNLSSSLLATTDMPMQEIVDQLNFCTTSNFIILFKEYYNITPSKYRKMHGSNINLDSYQDWGVYISDK